MPTSRRGRSVIQWIERQLRLGLPGYCAFCLGEVKPGMAWCGPCFAALPWNHHACRLCAEPLTFTAATRCRECLALPPAFARAHAPLLYQEQIRPLMHAFKFNGEPRAGLLLMMLFMQTLQGCPSEALLPVPLHLNRSRERGFNQSQWLAKQLHKAWDRPLMNARRVVDTPSQRLLGRSARRRNLEGVFAVTSRLPKRVAIIDDVLTTGATAHALALAAKEAGAEEVTVYALARTPRG
ncbi:ComF family protein [Vreelandella massiliensis]|uniref:ComF family protein n=1 Tax=Vreelandella massiliensis TaxID=1816686 RepID=UPI00096AA69B|nr:ComF family protein [Halomonas massiliensis]